MTGDEFDALHDSGSGAIDQYMDWEKARRPGRAVQRVNVDFPVDLLRAIDREADRIGVPRQAFIKLHLAQVLDAHRREQELEAAVERVVTRELGKAGGSPEHTP